MSKTLVIVFVKNMELGTVKTRLAKSIGNIGAYEVYKELVQLTETITSKLDIDKRIYFSKSIVNELWPGDVKAVQRGKDLGERMLNAFKDAFSSGYERVVLIGSDLPELSTEHILSGLSSLNKHSVVFGPAEDGGYYLIGLKSLIPEIFENKPWSKSNLMEHTLEALKHLKHTVGTLEILNDIDTYEDLTASDFFKSNAKLQQKIQQLND